MISKPPPVYAAILRATGNYTDEQTLLFEKEARFREIGKHEFLLQKGQIARSLFYLVDGAIQQYERVSDEEHNVIELHIGGEWILAPQSLIAQRPSRVFIEAFADSTIIEISLEAVHYLTSKSIAFLQLNKVLEGSLQRMQFFDQSMTPAEKYLSVLRDRPNIIQTFPLKMIASYLKITPETLSRVRNSLANGAIS